jgi:AraC-like DNA-binding protein
MPVAVPVLSASPRADGAYIEHAPPASLAAFVDCFWSRAATLDAAVAARSHRVLPDGCVDIILAFDARVPEDGRGRAVQGALAVGAMTRPLVFSDSATTSYLAVRFRPGVAGVVFGVPASEMTDERVPLADLWADSEALGDTLIASGESAARIRTLSAAIARKLLGAPAAPPRVVSAAAGRIAAARGNLSIAVLARDLGVTRQHLARAFAQHVGLSPKLLARIVRARRVVDHARYRVDVDWSSLALDAGYYDQSHLIAELKELTGLPPGGWLAVRS